MLNYYRAMGHRLRVTRIALDLSEQDAADACGVSLPTYRKYELGRPMKDGCAALRFASKYAVSLDWLLVGDTSRVRRYLTKGKIAILPAKGAAYRENVQKYYAALASAKMWRQTIMPPDSRGGPLDAA